MVHIKVTAKAILPRVGLVLGVSLLVFLLCCLSGRGEGMLAFMLFFGIYAFSDWVYVSFANKDLLKSTLLAVAYVFMFMGYWFLVQRFVFPDTGDPTVTAGTPDVEYPICVEERLFLHRRHKDWEISYYMTKEDTTVGMKVVFDGAFYLKEKLIYDKGIPAFSKVYFRSGGRLDSVVYYKISKMEDYWEYGRYLVWQPGEKGTWFRFAFKPLTNDTLVYYRFRTNMHHAYISRLDGLVDTGFAKTPDEKGYRLNGRDFSVAVNRTGFGGYNAEPLSLTLTKVYAEDEKYEYYEGEELPFLLPYLKTGCDIGRLNDFVIEF